MLKRTQRRMGRSLPYKKIPSQLNLYVFPNVQGLEGISDKLNASPSEDVFGALMHVFALAPISSEKVALQAERLAEYIDRAFEKNMPPQVRNYQHLLLLLLKEYDDKFYVRAAEKIAPHVFLKALLAEDRVTQKSLVPDCFSSASQVSEFLNQKKSRNRLSYDQATALGKKFNVNALNFL